MNAPRQTPHRQPLRSAKRLRPRLLAYAIAASFALSAPVFANPTGAQVVAGQASFTQSGNTLTIANTPNAIINWASFNVAPLDAVRFQQQSALSSVLNRVTGNEASAIYGQLSSNGRVWLINPNGILFGQGSRIDIPGFIASTLNISDSDFLAGKMNFNAGPVAGSIKNEGTLTNAGSGNIYLVAPDIENTGIIKATNGDVMLAAGRQVNLVDSGHPDIQVVVSAPDDKAVNLGEVITRNGKISLMGAVLQQKGKLSANSVEVDDYGRIIFRGTQKVELATGSSTSANGAKGGEVSIRNTGDTYVSGNVSATGNQGKGGTIEVLGNRVAVMDNAVIDASGDTGGGRIMIGGDYQGKNEAVPNSTVTYFGPQATLKANAQRVGDGGTAIVWANDTTRAFGTIEAKGGANQGNGGFVETSGKRYLDFGAKVNTQSLTGTTGNLLLDPTNIWISINLASATSAGMVGTDNSADVQAADIFATGATQDSHLKISNLEAALNATDVVIRTNNASGSGAGNINVVDAVTWSSTNTLRLLAEGDLAVNASIDANGGGNLWLVSGWNTASGVVSPTALSGTGNISVANSVTAHASSVYARAGNNITTSGTGILTGYVYLTAGGNISANVDGDFTATATGAGKSITITDPGALITLGSGITTNNGNITLTPTGAPSNTLNGAINAGTGTLTLSGAGTYTVPVGSSITAGSYTLAAETLTLNGDGAIGSYIQTGGALGGTGTLSVTNSFTKSAGTIASTLTDVSINQASGTLTPGSLTVAGPLKLKADTIDLQGSAVLTGTTTALNADILSNLSGTASITATSAVTIAPKSTVRNMQIGGTDTPASYLYLSDLSKISAGTAIKLGSDDPTYDGSTSVVTSALSIPVGKDLYINGGSTPTKGLVVINAPITWGGSEHLTIVTGGAATIYANLSGGSGSQVVVNANGNIGIGSPTSPASASTITAGTIQLSTSGAGGVSVNKYGGIVASGNVSLAGLGGSGQTITGSVQSGGTIAFSGTGTTFLNQTGSVMAANSITTDGPLTNNGQIQFGDNVNARTLTVGGNFTQASTGMLSLNAGYGSVSVTGNASLAGGLSGGNPAAGTYTVLTTTGTVTGTFNGAISPSGATVAAGSTSVTLTAPIPPVSFIWDGSSDGDGDGVTWTSPLNWTADSSFPGSSGGTANASVTIGSGYGATISTSIGTITSLGGLGTLTFSTGGALTVSSAATIGSLVLGDGSLTGANTQGATTNNLTVSTAFSQTTGTISGFNSVYINQTAGNLTTGSISTVVPTGGYAGAGSRDGAITLKAPAGTIGQNTATTLDGAAVFASALGTVGLYEANPTGIISGGSSNSDFTFRSINPIKIDNVYGGSAGLSATGYVKLESYYGGSAYGGTNFSQTSPITAAGGLLLVGYGGATLASPSNSFSTIAASLSGTGTSIDIAQGVIAGMSIGSVASYGGISAAGAAKLRINNLASGGSITSTAAYGMSVGSATSVELMSYGGITLQSALSAKEVDLESDGLISVSGAVTTTQWAHVGNRTVNANFDVTSLGPNNGRIAYGDLANFATTGGLAIGNPTPTAAQISGGDTDLHTGTLTIYGATISRSGNLALLAGDSGSINVSSGNNTITAGQFIFKAGSFANSASDLITATSVSGKAATNAALYFSGAANTAVSTFTTPDATETFSGITGGALTIDHGGSITSGGSTLSGSNIGLTAVALGVSGTPLLLSTPSLTFNATNGAWLSSTYGGALSVSGSYLASLSHAGSITVGSITGYGSTATLLTASGASSDLTVTGSLTNSLGGMTVNAGQDVIVNGGTVASYSSTADTTVIAGRDIRVTAGSVASANISSVRDVFLTATTGKLYLTSNGTAYGAAVRTNIPVTVHLDVPSLSTGGYVIDTIEGGSTTSTINPTGTGIFAPSPTAAIVGSTFLITYAVPVGPTATTYSVDTIWTGGPTNHIYGQSPVGSLGYTVVGGLQAGETYTSTAATYNTTVGSLTPAGVLDIYYTGGLASSVSSTFNAGAHLTYTINPAVLTATLAGTVSKMYDGTALATLAPGNFLLTGFVGTTDAAKVTKTTGTYLNTHYGSSIGVTTTLANADLTFTSGLASNYTLSSNLSANIGTITQRPLTVGATIGGTTTKVYDGTTAATGATLTSSVTGQLAGDSLTLSGLNLAYNDAHVSTATAILVTGTPALSISNSAYGSVASDYSVTLPALSGISASITAIPLTVAATIGGTTTKVYDGTTAATGATVSGSFSGQLTGDNFALSGLTPAYNDAHVLKANTILATGNSGVTVTSTAYGSVVSDYSYTLPATVSAAGSITAKPLTVAATIGGTTTKVYDGTTAATSATLTSSVTGQLAGDSLTLSGLNLAYNDAHVAAATAILVTGTPALSISNTAYGSVASDYSATLPALSGISASITAIPLTVAATIGGTTTKVYDGTTAATGATVSGSFSGQLTGDNFALSGLTLAYNDAHVLKANTILATGNSGVTVTSTAYGSVASDYSYTIPAGLSTSGNITAKPVIPTLTIGGVTTKVYDGSVTASGAKITGSVTGEVAGDSLDNDISGITLAYNSARVNEATAIVATGAPALSITSSTHGSVAGDYLYVAPSIADAKATISERLLTVQSISALGKVYDGSTTAKLDAIKLANIVGNDVVNVSAIKADFDNKNVGDGKLITFAGGVLGGDDASNYALPIVFGTAKANITQLDSVAWLGGKGDWSQASSWYGGAIPDLSNVAKVIIPAGSTVSFNGLDATLGGLDSAGTLVMGGGNLKVGAGSTAGYQQNGGTFSADSLKVTESFDKGASGNLNAGLVNIIQASGNLVLPALSLTSLTAAAPLGAISQTGPIIAPTVSTTSATGTILTNAGNRIANFKASNSTSGEISLVNTSSPLILSGITNLAKKPDGVTVDNTGAIKVTAKIISNGKAKLTARSPITIDDTVTADGIELTAGATASAGDDLTINASLSSTGGNIVLSAGDNLAQNANVSTTGGAITATAVTGGITMASGVSTQSGGGAISYSAPVSIQLALLDAGTSGKVDLTTSGSIVGASGQTGANIRGATATIAAKDATLQTSVSALGGVVSGTLSLNNNGKVITTVTPQPTPVESTASVDDKITCLIDPAACFTGTGSTTNQNSVSETLQEIKQNQQVVTDVTNVVSTKPTDLVGGGPTTSILDSTQTVTSSGSDSKSSNEGSGTPASTTPKEEPKAGEVKKEEEKKDEKKDEKKEEPKKDEPAKKDEPVKKLYCN